MGLRVPHILLIFLMSVEIAIARPVSYPDGWTVMQRNNGDRAALHVHYSPTFKDSIGIYAEHNWDEDISYLGLQYNRLVKRWNGPESQANFYAKASVGHAESFTGNTSDASGFIELAADWETRRWFTEYRVRATNFIDNQSIHHSARLGVAPYIGDYGDLHTWFMVQLENHPEAPNTLTTTPLIRLFKGVQMVELGYTLEQDEWLANWIIRF